MSSCRWASHERARSQRARPRTSTRRPNESHAPLEGQKVEEGDRGWTRLSRRFSGRDLGRSTPPAPAITPLTVAEHSAPTPDQRRTRARPFCRPLGVPHPSPDPPCPDLVTDPSRTLVHRVPPPCGALSSARAFVPRPRSRPRIDPGHAAHGPDPIRIQPGTRCPRSGSDPDPTRDSAVQGPDPIEIRPALPVHGPDPIRS